MRFIDYVKHQNRFLVYPFLSNIGLKLTGYKMQEVYDSPIKQLEVAKALDEEFGGDFIFSMGRGTLTVEALGLKVFRPDYGFPSITEHPIKDLEALSKLKVPNPYEDDNMVNSLEALKLISKNFNKPTVEFIRGPFTLALELADANYFLRAIIKNPDFVEKLLNFTTQVVTSYAKAVSKTGVKMIMITEPSAVVLSPKRFDQLVVPYLRRVIQAIEKDVWTTLHICGDTTKFLDNMLECKVDGLSLDQLVDLSAVAPKIPKDTVIYGNLDPVYVLKNDIPQKVREKTLKMLKDMKDYPNFIFSFGCDCLPDTPFENLKAAIDSSKIKRQGEINI